MTDEDEWGASLGAFPHAEAMGMRILQKGEGKVLVTVPYDERLIGDPETGVAHGGVITTLLDTACGASAIFATGAHGGIATLDLRIDYMRPARPGRKLMALCETYRVTRSIAFARGVAFDEDESDPVATASGAFIKTGRTAKEPAK